jgi:E3 ubiquitin-protein ligase DRIP
VRSKIFPSKKTKIDDAKVESPISVPIKRKERSISSLVVDTPRITTGLTGRRTRAVTRKAAAAALRGLGPILDPVEKDNGSANKHADNISLLDSLSKVPQTRRKVKNSCNILTASYNVTSLLRSFCFLISYMYILHLCACHLKTNQCKNACHQ